MNYKKCILIFIILVNVYVFSACTVEDVDQVIRYDISNIDEENQLSINNMKSSNEVDDTFTYQFISDCDSSDLSKGYAYTEIEPNLGISKMNFDLLELKQSNIYFDMDIDVEKRKEYAKNICDILDYISKYYNDDEKINIYVTDKIESCVIDDNIYVKYVEDFSVDEITAQVLLGIYGKYSNYGLIYGETAQIMKTLNIQMDLLEMKKMKSIISKSPEYLTMMYPLYAEEYRDDVNTYVAKSLAVDFVNYLKKNLSEDEFFNLLDESSDFSLDFDKKYIKYMNAYLLENNVDAEMKIDRTAVRSCSTGNRYFPINISSELANYKFKDEYPINYPFEKYGNTYKQVIDYVHKQEDNLIKMTFFWDEIIKDEFKHANVYFTDNENFKLGGVKTNSPIVDYDKSMSVNNMVVVKHSMSFAHEMTHYLYDGYVYNSNTTTFVEGRAVLSELLCSTSRSSYINFYYQLNSSYPLGNMKNNLYKSAFDKYMKSIGKYPFDADVFTDEKYILDYLELSTYIDMNWDNPDRCSLVYYYEFGAVLSQYIIDNYGLDVYKKVYNDSSKMYNLCDHHTIYNFEKEIYNYLYDKFGEI